MMKRDEYADHFDVEELHDPDPTPKPIEKKRPCAHPAGALIRIGSGIGCLDCGRYWLNPPLFAWQILEAREGRKPVAPLYEDDGRDFLRHDSGM